MYGYVESFDCDTNGGWGCSLEMHHRTAMSWGVLCYVKSSSSCSLCKAPPLTWPTCWQGTAYCKIQISIYYIFRHRAWPVKKKKNLRLYPARSRLAYFWAEQIHSPSMRERVCPQGVHGTAQDALAAVRLTGFIKWSTWQEAMESLWHFSQHSWLWFSQEKHAVKKLTRDIGWQRSVQSL